MFVGISLALSLLAVRYVGKMTDFGDAASMGAHTTTVFAAGGGYPIHCQFIVDGEGCLEGIKTRRARNQVIWFGNSQLHSINNYHPGEQSAPALLSVKLAQRGFDLVTLSQPNANLQEQFVMFEYLRSKVALKQIILPVVFDDLRENGLREEIVKLLDDEKCRAILLGSDSGRHLIAKYGPHAKVESQGVQKALTPQEMVEARLNDALTGWLPIWAARPEMRGDIFVGLYRLRNTVFGITPSTKRKMILGRYADNMAALGALLKSASDAGIPVLMYVAPVGVDNIGERPYVESEYRRSKAEIEILTKQYGANFQNLENLVPAALWGAKDSTSFAKRTELDFMHFTSAGHTVLADRIDKLLRDAGDDDRKAK